jgi:N-acetylglutamate synthase-like GNAT family acetyltransferase
VRAAGGAGERSDVALIADPSVIERQLLRSPNGTRRLRWCAQRKHTVMTRRGLLATPLAVWERDGLKAALVKAGLPADDVGDARLLFWRFETTDIPVGFGGLEIHGSDALLRSLVTLPPLRQIGMGAAMVAVLETEARALKCRAIYLLTASDANFFGRLGYAPCARSEVPEAIRASRQFAEFCGPTAAAMVKRIG